MPAVAGGGHWSRAASAILFNGRLRRVLVLRRGPGAKFMPNSYVFPGGKLDAVDLDFPAERTNFDGAREQPIRLGLPSDLPLRVCAIRELFEESGLLPVINANNGQRQILSTAEDAKLDEWRTKITNDSGLFKQLFSANQQMMDVDRLVPWSNWLTPIKMAQKKMPRYDTAFFLIPTLDCPTASACVTETDDANWERPSDIVEKNKKSQISLPPPQFYELLRIGSLPTFTANNDENTDGLVQFTNPMRITPQVRLTIATTPALVLPDGKGGTTIHVNLLPGDHLYDEQNPDFTVPVFGTARELLPPYAGDDGGEGRPIHRIIYHNDPPLLEFHKSELYVKNSGETNITGKFHL